MQPEMQSHGIRPVREAFQVFGVTGEVLGARRARRAYTLGMSGAPTAPAPASVTTDTCP